MVSHLSDGVEISFALRSPTLDEPARADDYLAAALERCFWQGFGLEIRNLADGDVPWKTGDAA